MLSEVTPQEEAFLKVVKDGAYHGPDSDRHNMEGLIIVCDRCERKNLPVSIGLGDVDLCLRCVDDLLDIQRNQKKMEPTPSPKVERDVTKKADSEAPRIRMMQQMYQPRVTSNASRRSNHGSVISSYARSAVPRGYIDIDTSNGPSSSGSLKEM